MARLRPDDRNSAVGDYAVVIDVGGGVHDLAWVRIHDGAMTHPKLVGLADKAFRLWVWGLCYAQMHLTNGVIPAAAVPTNQIRTTTLLVLAELWDAQETDGWRIHDYLDWNDSRETVLQKQARARERMQNFRVRSPENNSRTNKEVPLGLVKSSSVLEKESEGKPFDPFTDRTITERAGRFIERYEQLYQRHRGGARYVVNPQRDYQAAVPLCQTWPDDRLDKLAVVFLTSDHSFAESGSRTISQFKGLASWCDGELAKYEAKHGAVK